MRWRVEYTSRARRDLRRIDAAASARILSGDERQEIKDAIDSLSEWRLEPAEWFINFIIASREDPVERLLANAPLDDEEVTDEDLAAFTDTDEDFRTGNTYTQEEVERELGLQIGKPAADVRGDAK